jgi:hypothetical protein
MSSTVSSWFRRRSRFDTSSSSVVGGDDGADGENPKAACNSYSEEEEEDLDDVGQVAPPIGDEEQLIGTIEAEMNRNVQQGKDG